MTVMPNVTQPEWSRFYDLRTRIFDLIAYELCEDPFCKSYEGAMEIKFIFPNYFDECPNNCTFEITLHCYILLVGRHKTYTGNTFMKCLDKLENDVTRWEFQRKEEMDEWRKRKKA